MKRIANKRKLTSFIKNLETQFTNYDGINPFWKRITDTYRKDFKRPTSFLSTYFSLSRIVAEINKMPLTNYLVKPVRFSKTSREWHDFSHVMEYVKSGKIWDLASKPESKHLFETALAADALKNFGLLEKSLKILTDIGMPPNYVNLRHTYYLSQIVDHLKQCGKPGPNRKLNVLEIGAGGGALRTLLKSTLKDAVGQYVIVDLPEMLCVSAFSCVSFFKNEDIEILQTGVRDFPRAKNVFVPAGVLSQMNASNVGTKFDLILNTHSFQEMDSGVIKGYFDFIYKVAAKDALFFNTNWKQAEMSQLSGEIANNDPVNFPYSATDKVHFWNPDPFHFYLAEKFRYKAKTPAWTSIRTLESAQA